MFRCVNALAKFLATSGGAGYVPKMPGHCGTAVGILIAWATWDLPLWQFGIVTLLITAVGIWAAGVADKAWGTHDNQMIVIDETAGVLVTLLPVARHGWPALACAFVLFRFFDIVKPPPVRWIDEQLPGGWGVVLDDVGAGVQAAVCLFALQYFGALDALAKL
jgi:phosphatidylglycerophosphatase A